MTFRVTDNKDKENHMDSAAVSHNVARDVTYIKSGPETDQSRTVLKTADEAAALRSRFLLLDEGVPTEWTAEHVGNRLIEAARVIGRMPTPRGTKSGMWPAYQTQTEAELRQLVNEHMLSGTINQYYATLNRVRIPPSSHEIARMEEAIGWPGKYLLGDPDLPPIVTFWAHKSQMDDEAPPPIRVGLRMIARGLRRDRVRVR